MRRWLARLLGPAEPQPEAPPVTFAKLAQGRARYAIGDVHGHLARLKTLETAILADAAARGEDGAEVVLLGDYVDRGPDSAGVLDRLVARPPKGLKRVCLRGNHEVMFARFLMEPSARDPWLGMGGRETLASYGLYAEALAAPARHLGDVLAAHVPEEHRQLLADLLPGAEDGADLFVHAGIDPEAGLDAQTEASLLWIREPFLSHPGPLPRRVIHGHTPATEVEITPTRIGVDTGAYGGGPLSAVRLAPGEDITVLTA